MDNKQIIEGNKLIAEYLGWTYIPFNDLQNFSKAGWYYKAPDSRLIISPKQGYTEKVDDVWYKYVCRKHSDLRFYNSWDSLIPVIEKLEKDTYLDFYLYGKGCKSGYGHDLDCLYDETKNFKENSWIENTWLTVLGTIKKYKDEKDYNIVADF